MTWPAILGAVAASVAIVATGFLAEKAARVAAEIERDQYAARVDELVAELAQVKRSLYRLPWLSPVTEPGGRP